MFFTFEKVLDLNSIHPRSTGVMIMNYTELMRVSSLHKFQSDTFEAGHKFRYKIAVIWILAYSAFIQFYNGEVIHQRNNIIIFAMLIFSLNHPVSLFLELQRISGHDTLSHSNIFKINI